MPFFRANFCEIDLSATRHNFRQLKQIAGKREILAIVKANAYGHGAVSIARTLTNEGAFGFGVATIEEGIELRRAGISLPILCLDGAAGATASDLAEYHLTPVLFQPEEIQRLTQESSNFSSPLEFHFKFDTGMGRLGISPEKLEETIELIRKLPPSIRLKGILSHLGEADSPDSERTIEQLNRFETIQRSFSDAFKNLTFHIANSAGLISGKTGSTQMVRPGIALYGIHPNPIFKEKIELKPVLSWKVQILSIKEFPPNTFLSYGDSFKTKRKSKIGVLPVGYADGYSRSLSNKGEVLVEGKRAPVVGRVTMDLTLIDLTEIPAAKIGSEAVLIGSQQGEEILAEEIAQKTGTIGYEVVCKVSSRVPRIVIG